MQNQTAPILLATDLSARGDRAFDRAVQLARQQQSSLVALHVMESKVPEQLAGPAWRRLPQDHQALAERRIADELEGSGVQAQVLIRKGEPAACIAQAANEYNCSLIVTGTARDETLGRLLLGTTVQRLARQAPRPVLVVKGRARQPYRKLILATDFSEASRHALRAALVLAPQAELTLFHAYDVPLHSSGPQHETEASEQYRAAEQAAQTFIAGTAELAGKPGPQLALQAGPPETLLSEYVFNERTELVAMGTQGRTGVMHAMLGNVAEGLLDALHCDVLIARQTAAAAG